MVHLRAGSQIETGKRKGSTDILSALAKALKVTLEEVIAKRSGVKSTVHEYPSGTMWNTALPHFGYSWKKFADGL